MLIYSKLLGKPLAASKQWAYTEQQESAEYINVRENRRVNQEWTIQRNWQHWKHKTQSAVTQNKNTKQHVLDAPICKQTQ